MDKFTQDSSLNRDLFTSLLTEKLENKIENSLILYNPDSLIYLLQCFVFDWPSIFTSPIYY